MIFHCLWLLWHVFCRFPGNVRVMVMYSIPEEGTHLNVTMQVGLMLGVEVR
jgi:hypothetical protein